MSVISSQSRSYFVTVQGDDHYIKLFPSPVQMSSYRDCEVIDLHILPAQQWSVRSALAAPGVAPATRPHLAHSTLSLRIH